MFNCLNTFEVKSCTAEKATSVIELEYVGMGQIKSKASKNQLDAKEKELLRNYEYQQSRAYSTNAEMMYQMGKWELAQQ